MTPEELSRAVREAFAYAANYVARLSAQTPSAAELLSRPDVDAVLEQQLDSARQLSADAVRAAWAAGGAPPHQYLTWLIDDVDRTYQLLGELRAAIRHAHTSGAVAVRGAVLDLGSHAALRARLTLDIAQSSSRTFRAIEEGTAEQLAGTHVWKQWRCSSDPPDERTCHWCRALHRVTVPLHGNFPVGRPADLTGHGRLTQPPRAYRGILPGPPRHPHCRCDIVILRNLPAHEVASPAGGQEEPREATPPRRPAGLLAASDIRAMPEERYQALVHFLQAAVHELGQVLARLRHIGKS